MWIYVEELGYNNKWKQMTIVDGGGRLWANDGDSDAKNIEREKFSTYHAFHLATFH